MPEIDPVILELRAKLDKYNRDLADATRRVESKLGQQERAARKLENQMRKSSGAISTSLKGIAGTLATYFTGRELVGLLDSFTRLQNNLRVAGQEGESLARVQGNLLEISKQYGVSVEALSGVFLKASLAQKELNATTDDMLKLNEIVAASLKITGTSTEEARGALLQLGQALGSDVVRAEEFNSLLENALPILQAAARGIDGMEGSVAKLRQAVIAGEVSSKQFFDGVLAGGVETIKQAEQATLTLAGGYEALSSSLVVYFGEADKANGISAALGEAMKFIGENLDTLIPALAVVGTALGVGVVTNAVAARIALTGVAGAASGAGAALLSAFGGPVGVAITAVTAGLAYSVIETRNYEAAMQAARAASAEFAEELRQAKTGLDAAASGTADLGSGAASAEPKIWSFANAVDGLTKSLWEQAKAAREARVELLEQRAAAAENAVILAQQRTTPGQVRQIARGGEKLREGNIIGGVGDVGQGVLNRLRNFFSGGELEEQARKDIADLDKKRLEYQTLIEFLRANPISKKDLPTQPIAGVGGVDGVKGKSGNSAKDTADKAAKRVARLDEQFANERASLQDQELRALAANAQSADERAKFELESLAIAQMRAAESIAADADYEQGRKDELLVILERVGIQQRANIELERQREALAEQQGIESKIHENKRDDLRVQLGLAETQRERKDLALQIFDLEQDYQISQLRALIASGTLADAKEEEARLALEGLERLRGQRKEVTSRDNETNMERYLRDLNKSPEQINEALDDIKIQGLERLNDGLADAALRVKSLGDVFKQVANEIIRDLIRIAIQQAVIKPLAGALGGLLGGAFGGGGGGGSGIVTVIGGGGVFGGGRASGGYVAPGQWYNVNEGGGQKGRVEGFMSRDGGTIIPLGQMADNEQRGQGGLATVRLELSGDIDARIQKVSGPIAIEVVRSAAPTIVDQSAREAIARARRPSL